MMNQVLIGLLGLSLMQPAETADHALQSLRDDATNLRDVFVSSDAQRMLDEVDNLPVCDTKKVYASFRPNRGYTQAQFASLTDAEKEGLRELPIEPVDYYSTFYGTPLVYARVLDLIDTHAPSFEIDGVKIMDLGYGQLGQLRLWAQMGADVTGVEVDHILTALYTDCAAIGDVDNDPKTSGSVRLVDGAWPNDESCRDEVGDGYDLLISRNLLKRGYVKPEERNPAFPVPVGWGMSDAEMLGHVFDLLNPGGLVVIESLGPAPDPTKPWSDISNPWDKQSWIDAGFEVLAHDADETSFARTMGKSLGWDARMDLENGLFSVYSIYRKPVD